MECPVLIGFHRCYPAGNHLVFLIQDLSSEWNSWWNLRRFWMRMRIRHNQRDFFWQVLSAPASLSAHRRTLAGFKPRPCRLGSRRKAVVFILPDQLLVGEPLPRNASHRGQESPQVAQLVLALVEAESLLVQIAEEMEGLN